MTSCNETCGRLATISSPADGVGGRQGVDRYVRRARVQRTGLAVVIVLVLVSAGVFLATRGTDEQRVISTPDGVAHYLPNPAPNGTPTLVELPARLTGSTVSNATVERIIWTNDVSDMPTDASSVVTLTLVTPGPGGVALRLDPVPAKIETQGERSYVNWTDDRGRYVSLTTLRIAESDLVMIRDSIAIDDGGVLTVSVPPGYREVVRGTDDAGNYSPPLPDAISVLLDPAPGYVLMYPGSKGVATTIAAVALPRSQAWTLAEANGIETTQVRGRRGYMLVMRADPRIPSAADHMELGTLLLWWEDDHTLLATVAVNEDEARALAESLRETDDETWQDLVRSAETLSDYQSSDATTATTVP